MINTDTEVTEQTIQAGISDLLIQCTPLFMEQTGGLSGYQMNFLKAIAAGQHNQFTSVSVLQEYQLGSKSNVERIQNVLREKDYIVSTSDGFFLSDPIMELWLKSKL